MPINTILSSAIPLFPLGSPRSGTTILARILNAHPKILMTDETSVFLQIADTIEKSKVGRKSGITYGRSYHNLWAEHLSIQARTLIEDFYEQIRVFEKKGDVMYWGEKHPHHNQRHCLEFIDNLYPTARYIYIVRDPRDVALSIAKMNNVTFVDAIKTWQKFSAGYEKYFSELDGRRYILSIYEELTSDYKGKTQEILRWLDLPDTQEVDDFITAYQGIDVHKVSVKEWQNDIPEPKPYPFIGAGNWVKETIKKVGGKQIKRKNKIVDFKNKSVNKWKSELTEQEKKYALEVAGDYIDKYGYER